MTFYFSLGSSIEDLPNFSLMICDKSKNQVNLLRIVNGLIGVNWLSKMVFWMKKIALFEKPKKIFAYGRFLWIYYDISEGNVTFLIIWIKFGGINVNFITRQWKTGFFKDFFKFIMYDNYQKMDWWCFLCQGSFTFGQTHQIEFSEFKYTQYLAR